MESKKKSSTQRRRTRNDPKNRDFKCGCGKSYLSYPALYTHLKDKHEAKKPPGTKIPETSGKGKRGRPPTKEEDEEIKSNIDENEISDTSSVDSDDGLDEFLYYLITYGKTIRSDPNFSFTLGVSQSETDPLSFPKEKFLDESLYIDLQNSIKKRRNMKEPKEKARNFNEIFADFLIQIAKHLKPQFYSEIFLFICLFRKSLVDLDDKYKNEKNTKNQKKKDNNESSNKKEGEFIIENANNFFQELPILLEGIDVTDYLLFGTSEEKMKGSVFIIQHFCNWLFSNNYSDYKLELNYNELEDQNGAEINPSLSLDLNDN